MSHRGRFITFEGPDGSGKTTQIEKLATHLKETKQRFILTREPGGTRISNHVRSLILHSEYTEMKDETEVLLYAASRAQHVREKIVPALEAGYIVLCDRFVDASIAYQGYGLHVDIEKVRLLNEFATNGLTPDRSYLIDLSPEKAHQRLLERDEEQGLDRIEQKALSYHEKVREGFLKLYEQNINRICYIDGDQSRDMIYKMIKTDFERLFTSK